MTIPNSALRFHPPDTAVVPTNTMPPPVKLPKSPTAAIVPAEPAGRDGATAAADARAANAHSSHGLCAFGRWVRTPSCRPVQIKTGISDGISTEVLSGLNEGDQVVTGVNSDRNHGGGAVAIRLAAAFPGCAESM